MFGIPEWAMGVAAILAVVSVLKIVTVRLLPPEARGNRWKGGWKGMGESLQAQDDMQARLAEIDDLRQRVAELEERVDFTERLLAKHRETEPLRPG